VRSLTQGNDGSIFVYKATNQSPWVQLNFGTAVFYEQKFSSVTLRLSDALVQQVYAAAAAGHAGPSVHFQIETGELKRGSQI